MKRKSAFELINSKEEIDQKKFCDQNIWDVVDVHIQKFLTDQVIFCENARMQGWLGNQYNKNCFKGLLGYLRTGFAIQLKILNDWNDALPIYQNDFVNFFKSDFFKNAVKENNFVKPIYKKEHFDIIKQFYS